MLATIQPAALCTVIASQWGGKVTFQTAQGIVNVFRSLFEVAGGVEPARIKMQDSEGYPAFGLDAALHAALEVAFIAEENRLNYAGGDLEDYDDLGELQAQPEQQAEQAPAQTVKPLTKKQETTQRIAQVKETLSGWYPKGASVCTLQTGRSASGTTRRYVVLRSDKDGDVRDITHMVAFVIGKKYDEKNGTINMPGGGYDGGSSICDSLGNALHGDYQSLTHRRV